MSSSILTTVKSVLGLAESYSAFDAELILHINSVLSTLNQIGVGPDDGFQIEDASATWESFLGDDPRLNNIKTYTALKVKMVFDPPGTSFAIDAFDRNIKELETRIYIAREVSKWPTTQWTTPLSS